MKGRGEKTQALKRWASKALALIKKHGPGLVRKHKLASRALSYAAKTNPKYGKVLNMGATYAAQQGYGKRRGGALRSVGGTCSRYCSKRH